MSDEKVSNATKEISLPSSLGWLMDAPLFIDAERVAQFYDAIVKPVHKEGPKTIEISESRLSELRGKLGLEASVEPSALLGALLSSAFDFKAGGSGEIEHNSAKEEAKAFTVTLERIDTPARQLEQLTFHYLTKHTSRIFLESDVTTEFWRDSSITAAVPRPLVFINLPGQEEAREKGLPETKLIPTAAEFDSGEVFPLYPQLAFDRWVPPPYPRGNRDPAVLRAERKQYWAEFADKFDSTKAMIEIEKASRQKGRIRWIDYRLPLTLEGDTLHLHICPAAKYDNGTFAYNFVKRGEKHGLRLVGTIKSEPDMNVLAIYDK